MKERPIIFSGPMVRAILDGRKTMTRRVVKPQPETACMISDSTASLCYPGMLWRKCPYGVPGDLLWVRETWATTEQAGVHPSDAELLYRATDPDWVTWDGWRWSPSIFMPRWASRLTLRIMSVSVERVQEIPEADARAEGFKDVVGKYARGDEARIWFAGRWDAINAASGHGWDANPWVWVVGFEVVRCPA